MMANIEDVSQERDALRPDFRKRRRSQSPFLRKAIPFLYDEDSSQMNSGLQRHLTLLDLVAIGIGGTIGSGLFVLAGLVAHEYSGPSAVWSWAVAGVAALISGCCYAELSARIPLSGSAYAYTFVAMGEWPAFLAAVCLSLEYITAGAAVSRSWGDKLEWWLLEELPESWRDYLKILCNDGGTLSPLAFAISTACVALVLKGVKESKRATNIATFAKVSLVMFMIVAGSFHVRPSNWRPMFPFGASGMLRGATSTFFGYLGYDQVCGLAGEAMRPQRDMPLAILITLVFVTCIYMIATLVLTGMQDWKDISPVSGFPTAFYANHAEWAGELTAIGEILTLPLVVLVQVLVQPRLQYAMAEDGLLPRIFGELDGNGNIWKGTLISGATTILIATGVPFSHLNNIISCAVLVALNMTDSSLILLWHEAPDPESNFAHYLVLAFNVVAFLASAMLVSYMETSWGRVLSATLICILGGLVLSIYIYCPRTAVFGGKRHHYHEEQLIREQSFFRTPGVPLFPCLGIFINWYLVAQMDATSIGVLLLILGISSVYYVRCRAAKTTRDNESSLSDEGPVQEIEAPYHSTAVSC